MIVFFCSLVRWQELDLSGNFLGLGSFAALKRSPMGSDPRTGRPKFSLLQRLALRSVGLDDRSMGALAAALYNTRAEDRAGPRRAYNDDSDEVLTLAVAVALALALTLGSSREELMKI